MNYLATRSRVTYKGYKVERLKKRTTDPDELYITIINLVDDLIRDFLQNWGRDIHLTE